MSARSVRIAPSILAADFTRLEEEIRKVEEAGAEILHLDVMDGHFVPNISFGVPVIESIRRVTDLKLDTHLMISAPDRYLEPFKEAGADSLTVHLEVCPDPREIIGRIHDLDMECGLVVNPNTPVDLLYPYLDAVELILIMSVEPGFGGQAFQPQALEKIRLLKAQIESCRLTLDVQVDGGINPDTAPLCRQAGASILVAGSAVFRAPDPAEAFRALLG